MEFSSIIIAAYNRCDSLRRLLVSIAENFDRREADYEVIVANNARDPKTAEDIAALAEEFRRAHGDHFRYIEEPLPGKCRAQNKAIRLALGDVTSAAWCAKDIAPKAAFFTMARCSSRR